MKEPAADESVSVVMPHYNASATLVRALQSVAAQTTEVREIIIVDDASTKPEQDAVRRIIESYDNVRLICLETNGGPARARNLGWDEASGEWVAFLDCDDAWHPKKTEAQLFVARTAHIRPSMIAGLTVHVGVVADLQKLALSGSAPTRRIRKRDLLIRNRMSTPSVMVRRDLSSRFPEARRFSEDYQLWLTIAGEPDPILFLDQPVAAIFKPAYGASGLSSQIWPMILGEYHAYFGARTAGALTVSDLCLGLFTSTVRTAVRLVRLAVRRVRPGRA